MPMYRVRGTCVMLSHQKAVFELEAKDTDEAARMAMDLDHDGQIHWIVDAWDNSEPATFAVDPVELPERVPYSPRLQRLLDAAEVLVNVEHINTEQLDGLREALKGVELSA